jgi:tripartite-type tricarboxylate transporter receptor subunit TctC
MLFFIRKIFLLFLFLCYFSVSAQDYPNKPVKIVVASAPGGPVDFAARSIGQKLSELWRQPVVIENKAGASEMIGSEYVAKSPADGYTLLVISLNPLTINPSVFPKLPYDPLKSFASIASITTTPMAFVANPMAPFSNFREMVAESKRRPGGLSWSTPGLATGNHIAGEWFASETGARLVHIPYKGGPAGVNAVIAGEVSFGVVSLIQALPFVKAGNVKILGVTSNKRSPLALDWPTVAELSIPGFDAQVRSAMFAPAATSKQVINKINADINMILRSAEMSDKLAVLGAVPQTSTPQELDATIARIRAQMAKIIGEAKITVE